jgi:hypothetical protein
MQKRDGPGDRLRHVGELSVIELRQLAFQPEHLEAIK